jgi:hypothetical protein
MRIILFVIISLIFLFFNFCALNYNYIYFIVSLSVSPLHFIKKYRKPIKGYHTYIHIYQVINLNHILY